MIDPERSMKYGGYRLYNEQLMSYLDQARGSVDEFEEIVINQGGY